MICQECGIEFDGRADAKFCSPRCRVTFSRKASLVTDNVTFSDPLVTDNFEYEVTSYDLNTAQKNRRPETTRRTAKYWYDIPLGCKPVIKKDWPECPDYMNGRQYFLWWKNNFKVGTGKSSFGGPIILNPHPEIPGPVEYVRAAEGSRRLGA